MRPPRPDRRSVLSPQYTLVLLRKSPSGTPRVAAWIEDPALVAAAVRHAEMVKESPARVVPLRRIPRGPYAREGGSPDAD